MPLVGDVFSPVSKPAVRSIRVAAKAAPTGMVPDPPQGAGFCGRGLLTPTAACIEACWPRLPCRGQGRSPTRV